MAMSREARLALQALTGMGVGAAMGGKQGAAFAGAGAVNQGNIQSQMEQRDRALADQERGTALRQMAMELQSRDFDFRRQVHRQQAQQYNNQMLLQLYQLPDASDEFKEKTGKVLAQNVGMKPEDFALRLERNRGISEWFDVYLRTEDPRAKNELWKKIQKEHPELGNVDHTVMAKLEGLAVDHENIARIFERIRSGRPEDLEGQELVDFMTIAGDLSDKELALLGLHDNVSLYQDAYWRRENERTGQSIDIGFLGKIAERTLATAFMDNPELITDDRIASVTHVVGSQMADLIRGLEEAGLRVNTNTRVNPDGTLSELVPANQAAYEAAVSGIQSGFYKDMGQIELKLKEKGFSLTPDQKAKLDVMFIQRDAAAKAQNPGGN